MGLHSEIISRWLCIFHKNDTSVSYDIITGNATYKTRSYVAQNSREIYRVLYILYMEYCCVRFRKYINLKLMRENSL